jgi:hypothetical protein
MEGKNSENTVHEGKNRRDDCNNSCCGDDEQLQHFHIFYRYVRH